MIEELNWSTRGITFDAMPAYNANINDLGIEKIKKFLANRKSALAGSTLYSTLDEAMHAYQIVTENHSHSHPTVAGVLLFGKNPQQFFSEARIMCNHFHGLEMGKEVIASKECVGTIDEQFRLAYNFVINCLNV